MATLINIDASKNRHRFYMVRVSPTLFGEWSLVREWGRIGSPGTVRLESYGSEDEARKEEGRTIRTRARHGYRQVLS
jgi:predicted DNA-binding WGR domain protein